MALISTHIRFALDVLDYYPIKDFKTYIAGTVYPDSRWMSGIDRELTHHDRFLLPGFPKCDFTHGWHVHCLCDEIQNKKHKPLFADLENAEWQESWIPLTVAKIIQDMQDLQHFDLPKMLSYLDHIENPHGESIERVRKFFQIIQHTYRHNRVLTPDEYIVFWQEVGLNAQMVQKLAAKLEATLLDARLVEKIENSYDELLVSFRQEIQLNRDNIFN